MSQALALLRLDFLRIRNWFRSYIGTKLIVLVGFLVVVAFIVSIEYFLSLAFFQFTATQQEFGKAVSYYSLNAALLLLFILAVVSSITSSAAALYRSEFLRFLLTIPISPGKLFVTRLTSALFQSTWVIVVLLTPILLAFSKSFYLGADFVWRALVVLLLLALSTHAIGGLLSVLLVKQLGRLSRKSLALIFVLTIAGSLLLMRFLFPPAFFKLYYAEDWLAFQRQLGQLPLLSTSLPTNWLVKTLTDAWTAETIYAFIATISVLIASFLVGKTWYLASWRTAHEGRFLAGKDVPAKAKVSSFPQLSQKPFAALLTNEFLAIIRSPSEVTYAAFLTSLTIALLFMMRSVPALKDSAPQLLPAVYGLSLVGISYLFMTLTARLVYPLIAREKRTSWLLFSIPVKRESILYSKISFALFLVLPSLALAILAASFLALSPALFVTFILLVFLACGSVALIQLFLGTIAPNFYESDNLEATSTSGSGLAAITLSLIYISLTGLAFYRLAIGVTDAMLVVTQMTGLAVVLLLPLFLIARRALHRYDL